MDSKRSCNEVIETQKDLAVYILTCPVYTFLKTFIESLLSFRHLWFGAHFVYGVRVFESHSPTILISLPWSFAVSLTSVYCQHNIPFSPHLLHQLGLSSFWQWPFWVLWGDSFLWIQNAFLIFSENWPLFMCFSFQGWVHVASRCSFL